MRSQSGEGGSKPHAAFEGHTSPVTSAVFSADGASIITASDGQTARICRAVPVDQDGPEPAQR